MKIKQAEAESLLNEWIEQDAARHTPIQPHEVTAKEYARKTRISDNTARGKLERWVRMGKWERRMIAINGRWAFAYRPKVKPE